MTDPQRIYTVEEYLAIDAAAPEGVRYEYIDGRLVEITGASGTHERLVVRIGALLDGGLRGRPCSVHGSTLRVKSAASRMYEYPDLSARCGRPEFEPTRPETLLNPSVLVEVLSASTEGYDHGGKFAHYERIPSLSEYLLVAQDRMRVERCLRAGRSWQLDVSTHPDDVAELPSVGCALRVGDVYDGIDLPDAPPPLPPLRLLREEALAWGTAE